MKKNQIRTRSRRKTPWDGVPADELDSFEIFLRREYHEHYSVHHVSISETDEAQLLNSFEISTCHLCGSTRLKDLSDKRNPMNQINQVHNQMQKFLDSHPGFNRKHLQDYINLFMFIVNPPDDPLEKIRLILEMGLTKPISLRYRKLYQHK